MNTAVLISAPGSALSHFACCPAFSCSQKPAPVLSCYDTVMFGFCHAPDVTWVAPVQKDKNHHSPTQVNFSSCLQPRNVDSLCNVQIHGFNNDTKQYFIFLCSQEEILHIFHAISWLFESLINDSTPPDVVSSACIVHVKIACLSMLISVVPWAKLLGAVNYCSWSALVTNHKLLKVYSSLYSPEFY